MIRIFLLLSMQFTFMAEANYKTNLIQVNKFSLFSALKKEDSEQKFIKKLCRVQLQKGQIPFACFGEGPIEGAEVSTLNFKCKLAAQDKQNRKIYDSHSLSHLVSKACRSEIERFRRISDYKVK